MNLRKYLSNVRDYDADDLLEVIGLQRKTSTDWVFPMLAGIGAGMAIGAGLAFFLTPYRGSELREKVMRRAGEAKGYLDTQVGKIGEKVTGSESSNIAGSRSVGIGSSMGSGNRGY